MLSQAGRSYDKTRVVSPYRTRQRFRYYQLLPVQSGRHEAKLYHTLDSNLREKRDSFVLRYAKDVTVNTDHSPNYGLPKETSPRHSLPKARLVRYIGDIRDEDYSRPLQENCDHRCAHANNITIQGKGEGQSFKQSRTEELPLKCMQSENKESLTTIAPLDLSKKMAISDFKSTEHSLIKKRSKINVSPQAHSVEKEKEERRRGISFDSSIGHQYLKEVANRQRYAQCYDIQKSNQSLIRKSFKQPSIHVKFPLFRQSIATRYDRPDPHWHLIMDQSSCQIPKKDLSYDFEKHSPRRVNEVKSKYPFRQCMNTYIFPTREGGIGQQ